MQRGRINSNRQQSGAREEGYEEADYEEAWFPYAKHAMNLQSFLTLAVLTHVQKLRDVDACQLLQSTRFKQQDCCW